MHTFVVICKSKQISSNRKERIAQFLNHIEAYSNSWFHLIFRQFVESIDEIDPFGSRNFIFLTNYIYLLRYDIDWMCCNWLHIYELFMLEKAISLAHVICKHFPNKWKRIDVNEWPDHAASQWQSMWNDVYVMRSLYSIHQSPHASEWWCTSVIWPEIISTIESIKWKNSVILLL